MNNLKITNSLTKQKELFKPVNPNKISMYVCGPTVYDNPHVGNARSLVVFDVLFRLLKFIYGLSSMRENLYNIASPSDQVHQ